MSMAVVTSLILTVNMPTFADRPISEAKERKPVNIPFSVNPNIVNGVEEIRLFVSEDYGKTWKLASSASPTGKSFQFYPRRDGVYSFSVMTVFKDGQTEPPSQSNLSVHLKVRLKGVADASGSSDR